MRKSSFASAVLMIAVFGACSDDDPDICVGHECVTLEDNEGGGVIFEFIYPDATLRSAAGFNLPPGVTTLNRVIAFFTNKQTPDLNPLPTQGQCNNLVANKSWPMYIGQPATELDVGELAITGKNTAGEDVRFTIPQASNKSDSIGRAHSRFYEGFNNPAESFLKFNTSYNLELAGGPEIPKATIPNALFLSEAFTVHSPGLEDNVQLPQGQDFNVKWNPVTSSGLPVGADILGVTWLVDMTGSPTHMCPTAHTAGEFTIPAQSIVENQELNNRKFPDAAAPQRNKFILLRNAVVHQLAQLPNGDSNNKRRLDLVTLNCWAQVVSLTP